MLPMKRFRGLVGPDPGLSGEELEELRGQLHTLAEVIVDLAWDRLVRSQVSQEAPEVEQETIGEPKVY